MNSDINHLASRDIAEILGVEPVTVRKYALALEKAGYFFERSDSDHRLFSNKDVIALQQLKALRERSGMSVETAAIAISTRHKAASSGITLSFNTNPDYSRYTERYDLLEEKIEKLTQLIASQQEITSVKAIQMPLDPWELRDIQVNIRMTERRVERQLRSEAENAWLNEPFSKRFKGIGFFRKENIVERDKFIMNYIDSFFESRIRKEFEKPAVDV
ncbi:MerR family transcriptional regulator [Paenibacillus mucilaginosus]|uniref:helix-turn-helix domain-containing protein n=1 Tax=Paenibacillus mucilaginosus TaxID=61624 RepID=UPI001EF027BB|nr:MerR family transcriptional regulator [Paenibacillus mucilaginosus]MCG7218224.1 MerR family transcriptional regulator [Paenibacillus mucilaginosus]